MVDKLYRLDKKKPGICMVVGAWYPEGRGGAIQFFNLVNSLKQDFDFYVIATYKVSSKVRQTKQIFSEETIADAKVFRINLYPGRIISEILSLFSIFRIFFKIKNKVHIFHIGGYTRKGYLITILAKIFGKKTIVKTTSLGVDDPLSIKKRPFIASKLYSLIDAYVITSPAQLESYKKTDFPEKKVFLIPNGVNLKRFNIPSSQEKLGLRREMHIPEFSDVILSVSFFSRDKGIDIFAESLLLLPQDKLSNIFLIFIGSRDDKELEVAAEVVKKVDDIIKCLNIKSRCLFIDSTHNIDKYFKASDIFILPSKREGLPNALLEAMACGLSCIANRLGGTTDFIISHNKDGYLLDNLDPNSIAEALNKTIGCKDIRKGLGYKARMRIEDEFDMDKIKDKCTKLYTHLLGRIN